MSVLTFQDYDHNITGKIIHNKQFYTIETGVILDGPRLDVRITTYCGLYPEYSIMIVSLTFRLPSGKSEWPPRIR